MTVSDAPQVATITGVGVVCPTGRDREQFFRAVSCGTTALARPAAEDPATRMLNAVGVAPDVDPRTVLPATGVQAARAGDADVVLCGGAEAPLGTTAVARFVNARALASGWADPAAACRPFDLRRNGFVLVEGAAVLVVERADDGDAGGAPGYADLIGWGATTDAYHPNRARPHGGGAAESMRRPRRVRVGAAISNSFAFGGHTISLVLAPPSTRAVHSWPAEVAGSLDAPDGGRSVV